MSRYVNVGLDYRHYEERKRRGNPVKIVKRKKADILILDYHRAKALRNDKNRKD